MAVARASVCGVLLGVILRSKVLGYLGFVMLKSYLCRSATERIERLKVCSGLNQNLYGL